MKGGYTTQNEVSSGSNNRCYNESCSRTSNSFAVCQLTDIVITDANNIP